MPVSTTARDAACSYAREIAGRFSSLATLAAAVNEAHGTSFTDSGLRNAYRRWRATSGAPPLLALLAKRQGSDFVDEPTAPERDEPLPAGEADPSVLSSCLQWGTSLERQAVEAFIQYGSLAEAAEAMGMTVRLLRGILGDLQRRAASRGWSPANDMVKTVPDGYHVKGVSTYYGADGELKGQWVKSQRDQEHRLEALLEAIQQMVEPFTALADPVPAPRGSDDELLAVYPMGDPHLGMHAWAAETGANFDLQIAERSLVAAVDHLVELAPPAREALVISLGDFFHSDNSSHTTARSGHALDVDTRWSKVLGVGLRTMRRIIDRALTKHERVTVICEIGNHDDHSSVMLALALSQFYEREPRVTIDTSPSKFHWYRFGANLVGTTHGDTVKLVDLPGIMACDRAADWGETEHRYFYVGHVHHDRAIERPGCIVETFRTLAPKDAWHAGQGYRAGQDMKCDVLHRKWGRVNRHTVGIRQIFSATRDA